MTYQIRSINPQNPLPLRSKTLQYYAFPNKKVSQSVSDRLTTHFEKNYYSFSNKISLLVDILFTVLDNYTLVVLTNLYTLKIIDRSVFVRINCNINDTTG